MDSEFLRYIRQNRKKVVIVVAVLILLMAFGIASYSDKFFKHPYRQLDKIVYVAGDGSGDFNCDGSNDQVEINQALTYVAENPQFSTVRLKGPMTYVLSDSIFIGSNTVFEGDSNATLKLTDKAGWRSMKPLIQQLDSSGNHNITIQGFEINGNYAGNTDVELGRGYYNFIYFNNCKSINVSDMHMHHGMGDGLRVENSSDIGFNNNEVYKLGHDGFYAINCSNVEAWDNRITCRTDSGLRARDSNHVKFFDNGITSFYHWSAGGPGILIEKSKGFVNDIEIYNNTIHDTYGPGIWLIGYGETYPKKEAQNVHIHHNVFYNTGTNPSIDWVGGIVTSGFSDTLIENNVFDGVYHGAVIHMYPSAVSFDSDANLSPQGKGYSTIVRNNIIINTQRRPKDPDGTGYGIINYLPEISSFELENNCLYKNEGGNYKNANSTSDIYADPLFVDQKNHDYRLKLASPCIDAGYLTANLSQTPESSNKRVNIGRYD